MRQIKQKILCYKKVYFIKKLFNNYILFETKLLFLIKLYMKTTQIKYIKKIFI